MKILFVGLGSIGKRHIGNVEKVLNARHIQYVIEAFRSSTKELTDELTNIIQKEYFSYDELPNDYDVIFVTNPTIMHYDAVQKLVSKTKNMFIEKPVFGRFMDMKQLNLGDESVYYVACPLRHKKVIQYIKKRIDEGEKFNSARAISSSYLPDWRKNADYTKIYSARKELGGGVELDLIHEWDYLIALFGFPNTAYKFCDKVSDLEINTEDLAIYIARYNDLYIELHLDYYGIESVRKLELLGNRKKYDIDLINNTIRMISLENEQVITYDEDDCYLSEMEYFFDLINKKTENINTIQHANEVIKFIKDI